MLSVSYCAVIKIIKKQYFLGIWLLKKFIYTGLSVLIRYGSVQSIANFFVAGALYI